MRVTFSGRTLVCLVAIPPSALDVAAFESAARLDRAETQVTNPQLMLAEYQRARLLVVSDGRTQLELQPNASRDLVRRATAELLGQIGRYSPRSVGFNGVARIELESGEDDPVRPLINEEAIAARLGEDVARRGIKLVYPSSGARLTVEVEPDPDDALVWVAAVNRHYNWQDLDVNRDDALSWFAALNDELPSLIRRLIVRDGAEHEHAA